MLPSLEKGNFSVKRDNYLKDLRQNVPTFLAYIELFGIRDNIKNLTLAEIHKSKTPSIGSGSLVNTQYVLT
jgi:hypothetical protein